MAAPITEDDVGIRILCRKLVISKTESGLQWMIGSPFLPSVSVASTIRCTLPSDSLFSDVSKESDVEGAYARATEDIRCTFRDPRVAYIVEAGNKTSSGGSEPIVLHGSDLDLPVELPRNAFVLETAYESYAKSLSCKYFLSETKNFTSSSSVEKDADKILVSVMFNRSRSSQKPVAPTAEYYPAAGDAKLLVRNHKLEVLFYVPKDWLLTDMVLKLIIPVLVDQLHSSRTRSYLTS